MSYRERMEEIVEAMRSAFQTRPDAAIAPLIHYGPQIVDMGIVADKLSADVERLSAIVNLIELKQERDRLAKRVLELEALRGLSFAAECLSKPEETDNDE